MKRTRSKKSRDTVPLSESSNGVTAVDNKPKAATYTLLHIPKKVGGIKALTSVNQ
jgi:hypothetical protein